MKFEEVGVSVFCGFTAINLPNIRFDVSGANALMQGVWGLVLLNFSQKINKYRA